MLALAMEFSRSSLRREIRRPTSSRATRGSRGVSCDVKDRSFRAARGAQRSASVRRPGHDWRTEVRVHVAVMLVGMLGVAVPPGGGRCAKS
jgi:hypothetical protein